MVGPSQRGCHVRIAALIAAALLWATLSSAVPAAALTIGPPPPTGSSQASVRAYYEARLAQQEASYESQLASLRRQLTAEKKQHAAADKTVSGLRLEAARSSASSEQVSALTAENEALKSDYASVLQARVQQSYQIEELKGEIRPPLPRSPGVARARGGSRRWRTRRASCRLQARRESVLSLRTSQPGGAEMAAALRKRIWAGSRRHASVAPRSGARQELDLVRIRVAARRLRPRERERNLWRARPREPTAAHARAAAWGRTLSPLRMQPQRAASSPRRSSPR